MKKFQGHRVTLQGQGGIVSRSFVAQESVLSIELVPGEVEVFLAERVVDFLPTFERHVRVLAAPKHQQLALDFTGACERVVARFGERTGVEISGVKTSCGEDVLIFRRGAKTEMTADTNAE